MSSNTVLSILFLGAGLLAIAYYTNRQPGVRSLMMTNQQVVSTSAALFSKNEGNGPVGYKSNRRSVWNRFRED